MKSKQEFRNIIRENLPIIVKEMNHSLGGNVNEMKSVLKRIGRDAQLPHWYDKLRKSSTLPNLDGKTVGSVIEMLFVGVLETKLFANEGLQIRINPARGVDLPDFDLGIKSPSKNYCTSEPFFSAYERLYGGDHDVLVLLTDYQTAKKKKPLRLKLIGSAYLKASELADKRLCEIARTYRSRLINEDEVWAQKFFKFLAYVNQSDWLAVQLLKCVECFESPASIDGILDKAAKDFESRNKERLENGEVPMSEDDLAELQKLSATKPLTLGIIDAFDRWVTRTFQEAGRLPNGNEWERLRNGPLDGKIGISPALQWRYNFGALFREKSLSAAIDLAEVTPDDCEP